MKKLLTIILILASSICFAQAPQKAKIVPDSTAGKAEVIPASLLGELYTYVDDYVPKVYKTEILAKIKELFNKRIAILVEKPKEEEIEIKPKK